jgi:hypothetical protein
MFALILTILIITVLVGILNGWIVLRTSHERVVMSLEVAKVSAAIHKVPGAALQVLHRAKEFWE